MKPKQATAHRKRSAAKRRPSRPKQFEYHDAAARAVCMTGYFDGGKFDGPEMIARGAGKGAEEIFLPQSTDEFRLVVDGKWRSDPAASPTVSNSFGEANSLLAVETIQETGEQWPITISYEK